MNTLWGPFLSNSSCSIYVQHDSWALELAPSAGEQLAVHWIPPLHQSCSPPLNRINRSRTAPEQMYPALPNRDVTLTRENTLQLWGAGILATPWGSFLPRCPWAIWRVFSKLTLQRDGNRAKNLHVTNSLAAGLHIIQLWQQHHWTLCLVEQPELLIHPQETERAYWKNNSKAGMGFEPPIYYSCCIPHPSYQFGLLSFETEWQRQTRGERVGIYGPSIEGEGVMLGWLGC